MNESKDVMAQAVYLAQMEAAKGTCKCATCRILRKSTKLMTEQFLSTAEAAPGASAPDAEVIKLVEEED